MTNDLNGKKLSICKCDKCRSGYLIVKRSKKDNNCFLGCTNYSKTGQGCNNIISKDDYYKAMKYSPDPIDDSPIKSFTPNAKSKTESSSENTISIKNPSSAPRPIEKSTLSVIYHNNYRMNDVIYEILCCLSNVSERKFYGVSVLIDILRGSESDRIKQNRLYEIPEYGVLKAVPYADVRAIIEWMIDKHFILKTNHPMYPVLHPTYEGTHYKDVLTFEMLMDLQNSLSS